MKKLKIYGPFLLGTLLLFVIAIFLPELVFRLQDRYCLTTADKKVRQESEGIKNSVSYEMDMRQKLVNFLAADQTEMTISTISYDKINLNYS